MMSAVAQCKGTEVNARTEGANAHVYGPGEKDKGK